MAEALTSVNVPQAALDIIKEGTPMPQTPLVIKSAPLNADEPTPSLGAAGELAASSEMVKVTKAPKPRAHNRPFVSLTETVSFVSVNYRLPSPIPAALLRVSAERKVQKAYPSTQQEIVAVAVNDWLKKNGYLEKAE